MRLVPLAYSLLLAATCVVASGQTMAQTNSGPGSPMIPSLGGPALPPQTPSAEVLPQVTDNADRAAKLKEINERGSKYYAECLQLWDADTHMTKTEWARTCRRVTDERAKFLLDHPK